jgi:hypothetical protein
MHGSSITGRYEMSNSDQEREDELAELLREVRALRATIDQLQAGTAIRPKLAPNYAVLARTGAELSPNYEVLVRSQPAFLPPDYEVLVRPAVQEGEESSASDE